jgi:hypothetical protein
MPEMPMSPAPSTGFCWPITGNTASRGAAVGRVRQIAALSTPNRRGLSLFRQLITRIIEQSNHSCCCEQKAMAGVLTMHLDRA